MIKICVWHQFVSQNEENMWKYNKKYADQNQKVKKNDLNIGVGKTKSKRTK